MLASKVKVLIDSCEENALHEFKIYLTGVGRRSDTALKSSPPFKKKCNHVGSLPFNFGWIWCCFLSSFNGMGPGVVIDLSHHKILIFMKILYPFYFHFLFSGFVMQNAESGWCITSYDWNKDEPCLLVLVILAARWCGEVTCTIHNSVLTKPIWRVMGQTAEACAESPKTEKKFPHSV